MSEFFNYKVLHCCTYAITHNVNDMLPFSDIMHVVFMVCNHHLLSSKYEEFPLILFEKHDDLFTKLVLNKLFLNQQYNSR